MSGSNYAVQMSAIFLITTCSYGIEGLQFQRYNSANNMCAPSMKMVTTACIAQCLDLDKDYFVKKQHQCNYHVKSGNIYEFFNRNCSGCMQMSPTSPKIADLKGIHFALKPPPMRMCGKTMSVGPYVQVPPENPYYICGIIDESLKAWNPKNIEEIKCTIKSLPTAWQQGGKIGMSVFKSKCLNKFKMCDFEYPRDLSEEFVRLMVPAPNNLNLGTFDGTCAIVTYTYANKNVTDLQFREVGCAEKNAPFLCEVV